MEQKIFLKLKKKNVIEKVKIAFINPPHADWCLANNAAYLMFQSHYMRYGKYSIMLNGFQLHINLTSTQV